MRWEVVDLAFEADGCREGGAQQEEVALIRVTRMAVVMMVQKCNNGGEDNDKDDDDADKQYKHQQPSEVHLFKRVAFANLPQFRFLKNCNYKRSAEANYVVTATPHLRFLGSMSAPSCPRFC